MRLGFDFSLTVNDGRPADPLITFAVLTSLKPCQYVMVEVCANPNQLYFNRHAMHLRHKAVRSTELPTASPPHKGRQDTNHSHYNLCKILSLAERLLGFNSHSASSAVRGLLVTSSATLCALLTAAKSYCCHCCSWPSSAGVLLPAALRNAHFTALSSREWKEMIASLPPGASALMAAGMAVSRQPSSSFTAILSACMPRYSASQVSIVSLRVPCSMGAEREQQEGPWLSLLLRCSRHSCAAACCTAVAIFCKITQLLPSLTGTCKATSAKQPQHLFPDGSQPAAGQHLKYSRGRVDGPGARPPVLAAGSPGGPAYEVGQLQRGPDGLLLPRLQRSATP